jgi:aryl-alcohol dehydrogenase-like predicted oxidoreductase
MRASPCKILLWVTRDSLLDRGVSQLRSGLADPMMTEANFAILDRLDEFARKHGHSLLELAIGWLATQPEISSVISGATSPEQVKQNVKAIAWQLTAEEMQEVDKLTRK